MLHDARSIEIVHKIASSIFARVEVLVHTDDLVYEGARLSVRVANWAKAIPKRYEYYLSFWPRAVYFFDELNI